MNLTRLIFLMRNILFSTLLILVLTGIAPVFSQSGESQTKSIIINPREKRIIEQNTISGAIPDFIWLIPASESQKTDFPVLEISGMVRSGTRLTSLKLMINGQIPDDNKTFLILPTEKENEYRISRSITLYEGVNELMIEAQNEYGTSMPVPRKISYNITRIDESYSEKRIALVIGNSNYIYGNFLSNPVNDANSISQALTDVGFTVLKYLNADQKMMKRAMDEFGEKLKDYNVGLFYYAGHGIQVKGNNYLIPVDAALRIEQDVEYDCIDAGRLLGKMEAAGTTTNIVILDACRNNPFERSWAGRSSAQGNGLAFMNAPSGSLIAYATSPGKTASDGTGKNGLYTEAILKYIKVTGMPIEEFFKNVRTMVETNSNRGQTPWESTSLKGNFYFKIK
jgi:hypothetical protein